MDPARIALFAVLLPVSVAAAALWLTHRLGRRSAPASLDAPSGASPAEPLPTGAAAGLACVAGLLALNGPPRGVPKEAWHWLLPLAVLAIVVASAARLTGSRGVSARIVGRVVVASAAVASVVGYSHDATAGLCVAAVLGAFAVGHAVGDASDRAGATTVLAGLAVVSAATAASLVIAGTMVVGQSCAVLAAACGACAVLSRFLSLRATGAATVAAALLPVLWLNGVLFAELPWLAAGLLAAAAGSLAIPVAASESRPVRAAAIRLTALAGFAVAAVLVARAAVPPLDY